MAYINFYKTLACHNATIYKAVKATCDAFEAELTEKAYPFTKTVVEDIEASNSYIVDYTFSDNRVLRIRQNVSGSYVAVASYTKLFRQDGTTGLQSVFNYIYTNPTVGANWVWTVHFVVTDEIIFSTISTITLSTSNYASGASLNNACFTIYAKNASNTLLTMEIVPNSDTYVYSGDLLSSPSGCVSSYYRPNLSESSNPSQSITGLHPYDSKVICSPFFYGDFACETVFFTSTPICGEYTAGLHKYFGLGWVSAMLE